MNRLPHKTSLVAQAVTVILEEIESGRWSRWLPGEHELCARLQVSRRTVRGALERLGHTGVLRCTQGKRREILRAKSRRQNPTSQRVVMLLPVPLLALHPFGVFLIDHLREHLAEEGYILEIHASRLPYRARMPQELENLAQSLHPVGWLLMQSTQPMQRWFSERQLPCVIVGSRYEDVRLPSVDTDYGAVCRHAVGRFLTEGRRSLVLLNPQPGAAGDAKTQEGFLEAAGKSSLPQVRAEVVQHDGSVASICARLNGLWAREHPPQAMLVSRPRHVLTVMGHLLRQRIRIPADLALISRDDESFLEDVVPTVARYSRNPKMFASKVSRAVLQMVHGTLRVGDQRIMPSFIDGETLG
jgi:DNA-binding LacI/PurR family transcriptional regulator